MTFIAFIILIYDVSMTQEIHPAFYATWMVEGIFDDRKRTPFFALDIRLRCPAHIPANCLKIFRISLSFHNQSPRMDIDSYKSLVLFCSGLEAKNCFSVIKVFKKLISYESVLDICLRLVKSAEMSFLYHSKARFLSTSCGLIRLVVKM